MKSAPMSRRWRTASLVTAWTMSTVEAPPVRRWWLFVSASPPFERMPRALVVGPEFESAARSPERDQKDTYSFSIGPVLAHFSGGQEHKPSAHSTASHRASAPSAAKP